MVQASDMAAVHQQQGRQAAQQQQADSRVVSAIDAVPITMQHRVPEDLGEKMYNPGGTRGRAPGGLQAGPRQR